SHNPAAPRVFAVACGSLRFLSPIHIQRAAIQPRVRQELSRRDFPGSQRFLVRRNSFELLILLECGSVSRHAGVRDIMHEPFFKNRLGEQCSRAIWVLRAFTFAREHLRGARALARIKS
ncbi:MAG: hypothetical protein AB7U97_22840, partial [Pirellulales bacterium]